MQEAVSAGGKGADGAILEGFLLVWSVIQFPWHVQPLFWVARHLVFKKGSTSEQRDDSFACRPGDPRTQRCSRRKRSAWMGRPSRISTPEFLDARIEVAKRLGSPQALGSHRCLSRSGCVQITVRVPQEQRQTGCVSTYLPTYLSTLTCTSLSLSS